MTRSRRTRPPQAALRIDNDPSNPGGTPQMLLRHYGFLGAAYPGKTPARDSVTPS